MQLRLGNRIINVQEAKGSILVGMTNDLAQAIEILRYEKSQEEDDDGFQRVLRSDTVSQIAEYMRLVLRGGFRHHLPTIWVARVGDRLILVDGQHRLEAWKKSNFPLNVEIRDMHMAEARTSFFDSNMFQRKVKLWLHLNASKEAVIVEARAIAQRLELEVSQVWGCFWYLHKRTKVKSSQVPRRDIEMTERVLSLWKSHKKWTPGVIPSVYHTDTMLKTLGQYLSGRYEDYEHRIRVIQTMSFTEKKWKDIGASYSQIRKQADRLKDHVDKSIVLTGSH